MSTFFISGPMSNYPKHNRPEFDRVEHILIREGHRVLNPSILPDGLSHNEYIHICKAMIDVSDVVLFLEGWELSKGATMERCHACATNKLLMTMTEDELVVEVQ